MDSKPVLPELPPETAPADIPVGVSAAMGTTTDAEELAHAVAKTVRQISRVRDLERLDGITIADDYDQALRGLDRGFTATRPLRRTDDDRIVGVAMAPPVLRNNVVKAHLVFFAPLVRPLLQVDESPGFWQAVYLIAHECCHIEDLKHRDICFPGMLLRRRLDDYEDALLQQLVDVAWEEYAACRASAAFAHASQASYYADGMLSVLNGARARSDAVIREYRLHGDLNRLVESAGPHICQPLKMFAYLQGHVDGLGRELQEISPQAHAAILDSPYATRLVRCSAVLRALWERRGAWTSLSDFDPLRDEGRGILADAGIVLQRLENGQVYIDVPFLPGTIPS